jgi:hypothetical protein
MRKLCPMIGATNVLGRLRRRRASLGRFVVLLFGLATLSAGAAPCLAMGASAAPSTALHQSEHGDGASHAHLHAAPPHQHSIASDEVDHAPSPCSHCPLAAVLSGDAKSVHAFCAAVDDVSDGGKPVAKLPPFKYASLAALVEALPIEGEPSPSSPRRPPAEAAAPSVALNLLHCVFLI